MKKLLEKIKEIKTGEKIKIIGFAMALLSWVPPLLLMNFFSSGLVPLITLIALLLIGGYIAISGFFISKRESEDITYEPPKNPFKFYKLFKLWQIFLMLSVPCMFVGVLTEDKNEDIAGFFYLLMFLSLLAAAVSAVIRKNRQRAKRRSQFVDVGDGKFIYNENLVKKCAGCGTPTLKTELQTIGSREYCRACVKKLVEKNNKEAGAVYTDLNTPCSVCGREFPASSMLCIKGKYFCEECFQAEYGIN